MASSAKFSQRFTIKKGGNMKQKLKKILIASLAILLLNSSIFVYSQYQNELHGKGKLQVASPKIRLISNPTHLEVLDKNTYFTEFQVLNYDENQQISKVNLSYKISVKTNPIDAPLKFELYQLEPDNTEVKTDLTNSFSLKANEKQEHLYKLGICYDLSDTMLEDDTEVFIELETLQTI